jgi:hypothetical protein
MGVTANSYVPLTGRFLRLLEKDEYDLNDPIINNKAVEGKEEDSKDQDGDALMDTP